MSGLSCHIPLNPFLDNNICHWLPVITPLTSDLSDITLLGNRHTTQYDMHGGSQNLPQSPLTCIWSRYACNWSPHVPGHICTEAFYLVSIKSPLHTVPRTCHYLHIHNATFTLSHRPDSNKGYFKWESFLHVIYYILNIIYEILQSALQHGGEYKFRSQWIIQMEHLNGPESYGK